MKSAVFETTNKGVVSSDIILLQHYRSKQRRGYALFIALFEIVFLLI